MNALFSGLFAGVVAVGATVALERFGGVLGGILATIPTTIVPASIGFWLNSDGEGFRAALYAVPLGMLLNAVFLHVWRWLPSKISHLPPRINLSRWSLAPSWCGYFVRFTVVLLEMFFMGTRLDRFRCAVDTVCLRVPRCPYGAI